MASQDDSVCGDGASRVAAKPVVSRAILATIVSWCPIGLIGAVGHEPRPRAPAAAWPAHERPGGRVPGPCRLATWQEGRVARIVDDQGLIAIGVDWSV